MRKLILLLALLVAGCSNETPEDRLQNRFQACRNTCVALGAETFDFDLSRWTCSCGGTLP